MKPPKCRFCGEPHWTNEPHKISGTTVVATVPPGTRLVALKDDGVVAVHPDMKPLLITKKGAEEIEPKFDRVAYQREYMKKYRAKKAKK